MYELPVVAGSCRGCRLRHLGRPGLSPGSSQRFSSVSSVNTPMVPPGARVAGPGARARWGSRPRTMQPTLCSCCLSRALASALLLSLLLPELSGPSAGRPPAARAAPDPRPAARDPRTRPPPPPEPSAARPAGRAPALEAAGARGAEGGNGSTPGAGPAADDPGGKAGPGGPAGGVLAVSPDPGDKPMTQRALTVLVVVSGAVLVYFVVRTVRWGEASASLPRRPGARSSADLLPPPSPGACWVRLWQGRSWKPVVPLGVFRPPGPCYLPFILNYKLAPNLYSNI